MLFNSIEFAVFLPIVFALYWFVAKRGLRLQNLLIVAASFIFYGWWDWRFLLLLILSASVDFLVGILLNKTDNVKSRKWLVGLSICVNLGILGFFKYYNFFANAFLDAFTLFGVKLTPGSIEIILPVGISFYTFQALSYSIDVYRKKLQPTRDIIAYFAFISFFPQLVAGPIERATNLLPQFYSKRTFDYSKAIDGLRQILWGLFKKIVIADNCAIHANRIFDNYGDFNGSTLALGAIFFALQIYGDFSGYSDIALGTSRLFGFSLMRNFAFPYFSRDIAEFWRRWHISLTTWFRDYLYFPLGGSHGPLWKKVRNTFIIFLVSGFWHGANWTFIAWGLINAIYFLPLLVLNKNRSYTNIVSQGSNFPSVKEFLQIVLTFSLTSIAWVFFRSKSITDAILYLDRVFSKSFFTIPSGYPIYIFSLILLLIGIEWLQREREHALQLNMAKIPTAIRWAGYFIIILLILIYGANQQEFIYFQF